ncbi:hypothetical protein DFH08DRAFT_798615 [Mycena albidolilacea]|uniref:Uncharacterized protein n=1 Tax=Mycena albidolilacea TaxID=1033008 RepID=A0AAD7ANP9_9AGAR|nr:hypothetical protein DFH08DRAFT_798615 [Mycena albidolilacea]
MLFLLRLRILLIAALCRRTDGAAEHKDSESRPPRRPTLLKPFIPSNLPRQAVISGLLGLRDIGFYCDPGYSLCNSLFCCPTGDNCCSTSTVFSTAAVQMERFAPETQIRTAHRRRRPQRRNRPRRRHPLPKIPIRSSLPDVPSFTYPSVTYPEIPTLPGASRTTKNSIQSVPTPAPTVPSGSNQIGVDVSDSNITWTGNWVTVQSSCSSGKAKMISSTEGGSLPVKMISPALTEDTGPTSVSVKVASTNAWYTITLDTQTTTYGDVTSRPAPANCTFGWTRVDLPSSQAHVVRIVAYGATGGVHGSPWSLEVQNLVLASVLHLVTPNLAATPPISTSSDTPARELERSDGIILSIEFDAEERRHDVRNSNKFKFVPINDAILDAINSTSPSISHQYSILPFIHSNTLVIVTHK